MLGRIFFYIIFFSTTFQLSAQKTYKEAKKKSLAEIFKLVENDNDISFSYDDNRVQEYKISYKQGKYTLNEFLDLVFRQTALGYEYVDDNHIIVVDVEESETLVCGYILDADTGGPLEFATISDIKNGTGVVTDKAGYFEVLRSTVLDSLICSYLGYHELTISTINSENDGCVIYQLSKKENLLNQVEVIEYLDDGVTLSGDASTVNVNPDKMNMLPGNIDKDILSSLQFLPGITSPNESLSGLHIRGGTPDQNLVLWDDIPMYHVSHMFGAISIFNPFIISNVNVHRNGVSSRYGGRVSGIIDIESKRAKPAKIKGGVGFNMMQTHIELEVPIRTNSALFFSTRFSLTDEWNSPTFLSHAEKVFQGSKVETGQFSEVENQVNFEDFSLRYIYDNDKNKIDFSVIASLNRLLYQTSFNSFANAQDNLELAHGGSKLGWERKWKGNLSTEVVFTDSRFTKDYKLNYKKKESLEDIPVSFTSKNDLRESNFRIGAKWDIAENKSFAFGYQVTKDSISLEIDRKNFEREILDNEFFVSDLHAVYGDYHMSIAKILELSIGLRYQYSPTLKNEYFEPRISLSTPLNDHTKLKLSTSKNFQFISQLVSFDVNELGFGNEIWIAANNSPIPVIEANQWTGGLIYSKDNWTIDLDAYVKELTGLTSFSDSFDPNIDVAYSTGTARISGLDFLIKRRIGKYKSWVSYSFSKANYEFLRILPSSFPATFDQRHILQWVHMYNYNKWSFSLGITAKSGLPYSVPDRVEDNTLKYETFNRARLDNYFRIDGSLVYKFKDRFNSRSYLAVSIQNLSGRNNQLSRRYLVTRDENNQNPTVTAIDLLGIGLTPNISANISF